MSNGKDTNSIYDYSMIFNNINKVAEIKDDNNVNNDKDNNLYNTNLISDLDLQNFDPKRYEYYTNLVYIYNKDPKTLYDLLNKYYSIKNIKDKEKKLIRIISNYARLHKEAEKAEKAPSKEEVELLKSIDALIAELKVADKPDLTIDNKVCYLIMNIILKIVEVFEGDTSKNKLIEDLVKLFRDDKIIKSSEYLPDTKPLPAVPADLNKYHIDMLKPYINNILKDSTLHTIVLNDDKVYKEIEDYYIENVKKAHAHAGFTSLLTSSPISLQDYLDEINKHNTKSSSPIVLDLIWQLYIDFKNNYKKYKEESAKKTVGGAAGEKPTGEKPVIVPPENGLEKLIEEIEDLIVDKIDDANDEPPKKKTTVASIPLPIASTSTPAPGLPTKEELETLIERIEKLEFAIQNTPGTGKLLLGNKIAKDGILFPLLKSANDKTTYKKAVQSKDKSRKAVREQIVRLLPKVNQILKNKIEAILKIKRTLYYPLNDDSIYTIDIKKKSELKEFYDLINFPIIENLNLICKKLAQLYTDDLRKELIKHTVLDLHNRYKTKYTENYKFFSIDITRNGCTQMKDNVGSIVKMNTDIDINYTNYTKFNKSEKIDDDNTRVYFDDKYNFVMPNDKLKRNSKEEITGINSGTILYSNDWEGVVQDIETDYYIVKFINNDDTVVLVYKKNCDIVKQQLSYEQHFQDDSNYFNSLNEITDIGTIINTFDEFRKRLLLDLDILLIKIGHLKKCYEEKIKQPPRSPMNTNMINNYSSDAIYCNDLIDIIKNPQYIYDIIDSLFPDKRKKYVIDIIITHLQSIERIKNDASKLNFLTYIKKFIDILKFVPTEKPAIFDIIQKLEKHRNENLQDKSYNYYINIIINKLTTLFTVNDDVYKEHHYPNSFRDKTVQLYGTNDDFGTVKKIEYEKDANNRISSEIVKLNIELPNNAGHEKKDLIDIIIKDQQSGGAYIGDDALKMRFLNNKNEEKEEDILDKLKIIQESNSQGKKKTSNKIEQLSNDIDYYNKLENKDSNATKKIIQQINNFENDPNNPIEELALTFDDRLVFIIATFFIRYITLMFVQWSIDINIIKTFYEGFIYYAIIYIIIFWFIVLFINVDNSYDVNYMNFNGIINSIRTLFYYFYMGTNGISRLLIHTSLIIILIIVPIILNIKNKVEFVDEEENENAKILNNDERKQLSKSLSLFTMFIWLFTSIIATKF
jgi:hypothetical protein